MISRTRILGLMLLPLLLSSCEGMPSWLGGYKKQTDALPGERITVLADRDMALKADSTLAGSPIALPDATPLTEWPQHSGNAASAVENPTFSSSLSGKTSASIGKHEGFEHGSAIAPIVANGKVFAMDASGHISAHNAHTIQNTAWVSPGVSNKAKESMLGGGLAYADGTVYAVSGRGLVAALSAKDGKELWRQDLGVPVRAAPKIDGGKLFVVTIDSQLYALDGKTGSIAWNHRGIDEGASFLSHASPSISHDIVIAPYSSGEIFALNSESGKDGWSDSLASTRRTNATGLFNDISSDPVILNNALYVASNSGIVGAYRMDNGARVWEQTAASVNPLWVSGNALFMLTVDNTLVAMNRMDGRIYWVTPLPLYKNTEEKKGRFIWSGPTLAGGKLYVAGANGEMRVFSPISGELTATLPIPEGITTAPVVADNAMYLVDGNATLYSLQ